MTGVEMVIKLGYALAIFYHVASVQSQLLQPNSVHKTPGAERPANELWCHRCHTMEPEDKCDELKPNYTAFAYKCKEDKERLCMIKRISYTTSNENATSKPKMWSLERNCTKQCEPGCIVIGERTKLYACTTCCDSNLCNSGTGRASSLLRNSNLASILATILVEVHLASKEQSAPVRFFQILLCTYSSLIVMKDNKWIDIL